MSIDTACSSSLVAMHLGAKSCNQDECSASLVCGVNLILLSRTTEIFQRAGMLSRDGRCKTLDSTADGYVRSEGCEVLHLIRGYDGLHTVIVSGSAVNQDGRSSSLTAPNGPSQRVVIETALENACADACSLSKFYMHGTGTSLGDPIEIGGILSVVGHFDRMKFSISAVKTYFGHSECASGISSILCAVQQLEYSHVSHVMHLICINNHISTAMLQIESDVCGVYLPREMTASSFVDRSDVYTGTSAFAFQGTNCHVIVCQSSNCMSLPQQHVILNVYQLFSHRRYWIVPNIMELTSRYKVTHSNGFIRILLSIPTNISDHNVRGRQIFPASGFLEAASQTMIAFMNPNSLVSFVKDVAIVAPLIMKVSGSTIIDSDPIQGTFCIESHVRQHCYGHFSNRKSEDYRRVRGKEYFSQIMIEKISFGVAVCASANALSSSEKYLIHPSLLDAILQLNISSEVCINASLHNGKLHLPASASSYQISSSGEIDKMYSRWNLAGNFNQCFDNKHSNTISGIRRTASIFQLEYKILREGPKMSECQASLDKVNGTINSCSFYALQSIFESNERSFESITTVIDASRKCLGLFVNLFVSNKMKDHFLVLNTSEESPLQMSLAIFKNECQMNHPSQKLERNILRKEILETNVVIDSQKNMCLTPLEPNIICI